jgi:hypothetical protein
MTELILVCMLHFNTSWLGVNIHREDVIVNSQAQCNKIATAKGRGIAGVGSVIAYDMASESERKLFRIRCGEEGKDCKNFTGENQ